MDVWDTMIDRHDELGLRYSSMMESVGEYLRSNHDYYERNGWDNEPDQPHSRLSNNGYQPRPLPRPRLISGRL